MNIKFSKMHALGNDFVITNNIQQKLILNSNIIKQLSNRHTGIGFDQLLIAEISNVANIDFNYRIFNADGTEVEQCGNGARCFALYLKKKCLTLKNNIFVKTKNRVLKIKFLDNNIICVNMGIPLFLPKDIPYITNKTQENYKIKFHNKYVYFNIVSIGNPHCVIQVPSINNYPVKLIGSFIEDHHVFPKKINVNFMEIVNNTNIKLRVYERGVGETYSCGSGACASVAVGIKKKLLSHNVQVDLMGGYVKVIWDHVTSNLFLLGTACHIYDGNINI
ncbi:diaminopimelate epimerase [Enterobacteriaceae endosymbiont of Macroplea appendiculata]|uniref:diaminopimelate epimerase n=1 Tax=Enterobacteriaceae endosymbiont of Macroplea appendiculata TaxID=2675790 RepID=UPI001449BAEB|nr:diaminopimelate epimerase [Enterobacteriaceae endosymbiont of Macroplea appendiculata]QJC30813.1 diaminopimelate epimerase [Enterobacteriaceae endosymbiont of Macroplea appendiculata]